MQQKIKIDPDELTLNEVKELNGLIPGGFAAMVNAAKDDLPLDALIAIAYLVKRRDDPAYTLEAAGDLRLGDFDLEGLTPGEGPAAGT